MNWDKASHDSAEPECQVTVTDPDGKAWAMKVRANSVYAAVFAYNHQQICGQYQNYPKLQPATAIEIQAPDNRVFSTTFAKARDWANQEAERQIRK